MIKKGILILRENKPVVLTVIFFAILADIIFIKGNSDVRIFGILGLYIVGIFLYKLKSRLTFLFGLALLGIMYVEFLFTRTSESTEKAAVWFFFFLGIGIVQQLKEK